VDKIDGRRGAASRRRLRCPPGRSRGGSARRSPRRGWAAMSTPVTAPSRLIVAHEAVTHGGVGAGSRSARRSRTRTFRAWKRSSPPSGAWD